MGREEVPQKRCREQCSLHRAFTPWGGWQLLVGSRRLRHQGRIAKPAAERPNGLGERGWKDQGGGDVEKRAFPRR